MMVVGMGMVMVVMAMTKMDRLVFAMHEVMMMAESEWEGKKGKVERECRVPWLGPTRLRQ